MLPSVSFSSSYICFNDANLVHHLSGKLYNVRLSSTHSNSKPRIYTQRHPQSITTARPICNKGNYQLARRYQSKATRKIIAASNLSHPPPISVSWERTGDNLTPIMHTVYKWSTCNVYPCYRNAPTRNWGYNIRQVWTIAQHMHFTIAYVIILDNSTDHCVNTPKSFRHAILS